jgi:hypothetical protein
MYKRIASALGALVCAAGLALTTAPAAQAVDGVHTAKACQSYGTNIQTCVQIRWSPQGDGTGARLEWLAVTTPSGCNNLTSDRYNPWEGYTVTNGNVIDNSYDYGFEDCTFSKDLNNPIGEAGCGRVNWNPEAHVSGLGTRTLLYEWEICGAGSYTLRANSGFWN